MPTNQHTDHGVRPDSHPTPLNADEPTSGSSGGRRESHRLPVELHHGECVRVMRAMDDNCFDAVVTDPPYGFAFMKLPWDALTASGRSTPSVDLVHSRGDRRAAPSSVERVRRHLGQMRAWHRRWAEQAFRLLKPGGYLVAFGGCRTHHHLACALELVGFVIRDELHWQYAQGMPKSMDIAKAFIRRDGADSAGASTWRGWGTSLKPAHEPILLCQKPLLDTYCANLDAWGCGGLNVDGCRIPFENDADRYAAHKKGDHERFASGPRRNRVYGPDLSVRLSYRAAARFPSNVVRTDPLLDGYDRYFVVPKASRVERNAGLNDRLEQSGQYPSGSVTRGGFTLIAPDGNRRTLSGVRPQRNIHPTVKPIALMEHLLKLVVPPGGNVLDPFAGSGSTLIAAANLGLSAVGIEREGSYVEVARRRVEAIQGVLKEAPDDTREERMSRS